MSVFWYQVYQARLRERLLTARGLPSDSTCVLVAEPGKLDIKRGEPGILLTIQLMYCNRLHAWWSAKSRFATLQLFSLIARGWVG